MGPPASGGGVGLRPESFFKDEANPCAGESAQVVATFGRVESEYRLNKLRATRASSCGALCPL
jgi:hypothetical protein